MNKLLALLILLGTITFQWTHDGADFYRLYMGYEPGVYVKTVYEGPAKTCTIEVPNGYKLYFVVKAYKGDAESEYSNEVDSYKPLNIELER